MNNWSPLHACMYTYVHEYMYGTVTCGEIAEPAYWTAYRKGALADLGMHRTTTATYQSFSNEC